MRKIKTSIDAATEVITQEVGRIPTNNEVINLYHEYGKNWRQYDSFLDWYIYYTA